MNNNEIELKIDGRTVTTRLGNTILEAALENDVYIPNLCYNSQLKPWGACRLCLVEIDDGKLVTSCETLVNENMSVVTENTAINKVRKTVAELLIANHEVDCLTCAKNDQCKLQEVTSFLGINREDLGNLRRNVLELEIDDSNPFFQRDLKKCILCGICVRICNEILGVNAIEFGFRGHETKITTFADKPILDSNCVSCGECVVACPVGALVPKETLSPSREVKTVCPYCGVGCNLYLGIRGDQIVNVRGDLHNSVNKGNLCVKGRFGYKFVNHPDRLKSPLIKRNGEFEEVNWDEALEFIVENLSKYDVDEFAAISSARCTNEDNYILQKFTRTVMGTNNIDNCARSCHAPSVVGLAETLGSGAMSNSIEDIAHTNCIFLIGTNPTATYPVLGLRIIEAVKNGAKLIIIDPREIDLCKHADIVLNHRPGTDVALLMGIMRVIVEKDLLDLEFINERCENFDSFKESLEEFDLDFVSEITDVPKNKIIKAAKTYASIKPASILYSLGITEHTHGTENVFALSNLALLTGNIGKPSTGVNPIRGQNNVQGACDMGCLPDLYPGYQKVNDKEALDKFRKAWNYELSKSVGLSFPEILESAKNGQIKALYIMGENPATSEPDSSNIVKSLEKLEFLLVQDIFLTETARMADVVLPGCSFAEKDGTFTNTERRVQRVRRALESVGESKPDWWITCQIAQRMEKSGFNFNNPSEIIGEISSLAPIFAGISYDCIKDEGIHWPCREENDYGAPILHEKRFATETGRAKFIPLHYRPPAELPDDEYPFTLTTGRNLYHYQTSTMTGAVEGLKKLYGNDLVEINPVDALELGIEDGEIVQVVSRRGKLDAQAKINEASPPGVVFMTFHFGETPTNLLTNQALDPISKTPEFKVCAVRIGKIRRK